MALLHPDKLVGVTKAIQNRPQQPQAQTPGPGEVSPSKRLAPADKGADGALIEALAYRLRDAHQANTLNRLARVGEAESQKSASKSKPKSTASGSTPQIVTINLGPTPPGVA